MISPRTLAVVAAGLGALASIAGSPYRRQHAVVDVEAMARLVEREDDHVSAVELARWIKERHAGLRVIDLRPMADYFEYHVPTAEHISLDSLVAAPIDASETIVLYSEGGARAAQGWVFLRALGYQHVYFLRGGLYDWVDQVMNPTIAEGAPATERTEFDRVSVLSRYFGGAPRSGVRNVPDAIPLPARSGATVQAGTSAVVRRIRRRGC